MLKLYGGARTRATIVQWYLHELDVPYEMIPLNLQAGENREPAYLAINPMGKVPAIEDGDVRLWESGAILLYLADKLGKLGATPGKRGEMAQWVLFTNATLIPMALDPNQRDEALQRPMGVLNDILGEQPYITGPDFTVADVALGSALAYFQRALQLDLSAYPAVVAYIERLVARPAFQRSVAAAS